MSKYGDLIKEARKSETSSENTEKVERTRRVEQKDSRILENQKTIDLQNKKEGKLAGISIKVPEKMRRHWVVESKRKGKSMTAVIIEALTKEFGKP